MVDEHKDNPTNALNSITSSMCDEISDAINDEIMRELKYTAIATNKLSHIYLGGLTPVEAREIIKQVHPELFV